MAQVENGNGKDWSHEDHQDALNRVRSAASVSMSPELFEKLYLGPQTAVKGDLRKTFGNPTGIAIAGFILCLTPLSCMLMGWRGTQTDGGIGASSIPVYFFQGGILMNVGGFMELILGNTFPCIVFMTFGCFWLSFGGILNPSFAAWSSYAGKNPPAEGLNSVGFNSSLGFWLLFMGLLCFVYLIGSLRTNACFVAVFFTLVCAFGLLTGAYWMIALDAQTGTTTYATKIPKLLKAAGAFTFITALLGWWIFLALILASVDFPISIPLGDLSSIIKGANDRKN